MKRAMIILALFVSAMLLGACGSAKKESTGNGEDALQENTASEPGTDHAEKIGSPEENSDMGGESGSLQLLEDDKVGEYLADSKGMALYYFTKDEPETSNCSGECLDNWPPFTEKDFDVPAGFDKCDFGTITREDTDAEQVTYKGYPLYYFAKDQNKGDVNGQGVKDVWYLINKDTDFK
ncbi:hypothetical protein QNH23_03145 [Siminovitchia fortis]|uniref:Secreted repeat protein with Y-X4-D motif n=1 Tax=Siminovitchia fortis TaxID=254758 RepID=A0A443IJ08_9BACI|nr:hypothetical protein [Siminovitchia fortis]RWR04092.1 hypothetical protein D4N35_017560 [Siminovitchia fortis]WHY83632.1 hypothetical protein QNH23_03145 [Siminovitchia fortis]